MLALGEDVLRLPIGDPARKDREARLVLDAVTDTSSGALLTPAELADAPLRRSDRPRRRGPHGHGDAPRRAARPRRARPRGPPRPDRTRDVPVSRAEVARRVERGPPQRGRLPRGIALVRELGLQLALLPRHLPPRPRPAPAHVRGQRAARGRRRRPPEGLPGPDAGGGRAHPDADRHEERRPPAALQGRVLRGELPHGRQRRAVAGDA